jgi:hypothetical protein
MEDSKDDHGELVTYFETRTRWISPIVVDIPLGLVPIGASEAIMRAVMKEFITSGVTDFTDQIKLERKLYHFLWSRLSKVSQDAVRGGTVEMPFLPIEASANPYKLYNLIVERLLVNPSGNSALKMFERRAYSKKFEKFQQAANWDIHYFYRPPSGKASCLAARSPRSRFSVGTFRSGWGPAFLGRPGQPPASTSRAHQWQPSSSTSSRTCDFTHQDTNQSLHTLVPPKTILGRTLLNIESGYKSFAFGLSNLSCESQTAEQKEQSKMHTSSSDPHLTPQLQLGGQ